jgi:hypothetical protein
MRSCAALFIAGFSFVTGTLVLSAANASPAATNNQCWGDLAHQMGELGIMGTHSKASSPFNPTPADPRIGVANQGLLLEEQGRIEEGDPAEGGMGNHAIFVGSIAGSITPTGEPIVCDGTAGNPGPAVP